MPTEPIPHNLHGWARRHGLKLVFADWPNLTEDDANPPGDVWNAVAGVHALDEGNWPYLIWQYGGHSPEINDPFTTTAIGA